jgi:hypothetical protein
MRVMHTLRVLLICLGFAASDISLPIAASAFEVVEEGEEAGHHRTRRASLRRASPDRAPQAVGDAPVIRAQKPPALRCTAPAGALSWRPARKVPAATSEPASALEDHS